ncbi:hypothetical protein M8C17_01475 [Micromonospora sp. RHAY321]|uniref:hypothetical protein n=1 Tax=Micromonospora sp. RHAY321 TaxID=2944807 RepID=UPI00207D198A|nr:hypothetical protein [Micromonospora sp. RHAY321]MCO1593831.1 hypothetical protein [Micromonospora sp. RHAY321]
MARVEWSALSGDEVETVLSNLMYNRDERTLRIRPSQGDFGIDLIVPANTDATRWDVYQVKKFAQNLDSSQKRQIEKSFERILVALIRRRVPVNDWYLVTPLDPTLDNLLDWFNDVPEKALETLARDTTLELAEIELQQMRAWLETPGREIAWKGLNFCENLAADYGHVIDYYLHGGEARLRAAVADLSKLLGTDMRLRGPERAIVAAVGEGSAALLEPVEVREHLVRLDKVLDTDPHFRYGYSLDLHRPEVGPEPRLIAATQESIANGRWLTFKIYARSPQSVDERPIPLELTFSFEGTSPSPDREAFDLWRKYGKPVEVKASFKADFPGGLLSEGAVGRVRLSPAEGEEAKFRNRLRIVDRDGVALAELGFAMSSTSGLDRTGSWAHGTDDSGILDTESLIDATAMGGTISWAIRSLVGHQASRALAAVNFASHLASPNVLQVAGEYGPFADLTPIAPGDPLVDPALARFVRALALIQTATSTPIVIPDVTSLTAEEISTIGRAATLIGGHTLVGTWKPFTIENTLGAEIAPGGHYQFAILEPLIVPVNGEQLTLGCIAKQTLSGTVDSVTDDVIRVKPHLNDTVHLNFVTDQPSMPAGRQLVRFRPAGELDRFA